MPKDDYFVIVYRLLKYLYECLKKGKEPDAQVLDATFFSINTSYWAYIISSLQNDGYIWGVVIVDGGFAGIRPDVAITPKGIQYLEENSIFKKVREAIKDIRDIMPI